MKPGTDGKFARFGKSPLIMNKTGLFKQYGKTFHLSLSSPEFPKAKAWGTRASPSGSTCAPPAVSRFAMMGRIIYKGRGVSHIYLWVAIAFYELSASTPPAGQDQDPGSNNEPGPPPALG